MEERLRILYRIQLTHSQIDQLEGLQGELPLEIKGLKEELVDLEENKAHLEEQQLEMRGKVEGLKEAITKAHALELRYKSQQDEVRNDREYEALKKEIDYQLLEMELAHKQIGQISEQIEKKEQSYLHLEKLIEEKKEVLLIKEKHLKGIIAAYSKEKERLEERLKGFELKLEPSLLDTYKHIRERVSDGLAVVPIERGASAGSFISLPPQKCIEIAQREKLIFDEHSGRILVDAALAQEEKENLFEKAH